MCYRKRLSPRSNHLKARIWLERLKSYEQELCKDTASSANPIPCMYDHHYPSPDGTRSARNPHHKPVPAPTPSYTLLLKNVQKIRYKHRMWTDLQLSRDLPKPKYFSQIVNPIHEPMHPCHKMPLKLHPAERQCHRHCDCGPPVTRVQCPCSRPRASTFCQNSQFQCRHLKGGMQSWQADPSDLHRIEASSLINSTRRPSDRQKLLQCSRPRRQGSYKSEDGTQRPSLAQSDDLSEYRPASHPAHSISSLHLSRSCTGTMRSIVGTSPKP